MGKEEIKRTEIMHSTLLRFSIKSKLKNIQSHYDISKNFQRLKIDHLRKMTKKIMILMIIIKIVIEMLMIITIIMLSILL